MRIIIAGAFAIGSYLAKLLSRNKQEVVLMDQDEEKLGKLAIDYDLLTMHASATSIRSLKEARVEDTDLFIAVTPDESYNCLLYTSPSPRDAHESRMPSSA